MVQLWDSGQPGSRGAGAAVPLLFCLGLMHGRHSGFSRDINISNLQILLALVHEGAGPAASKHWQ